MSLQILKDSKGNNSGVFIPINDWKLIKQNYPNIEDTIQDIPDSHKKILDERLADYQNNPDTSMDFDTTLKDIRKKYNL